MSPTNTSAERDSQLLAIGRQCSEASCLLVDFLPFKCEHCSESFCADHFTVTAHKCPKYDENKHNRVAPSCPLCNSPVAIPPGQDPNIRMERHIGTECSVMTGKSGKAKSAPTCARGKCSKVLFAPISCNTCHKQYCPQHRFPKDHGCATATLTQPASVHQNALSAALKRTSISIPSSNKISPRGTSSTTTPSVPSTSSRSTPALSNFLSKTDRRAKAERESRRKAMMERAKKGLLTEQEKLILASEEAERAQKSDKNCVVM